MSTFPWDEMTAKRFYSIDPPGPRRAVRMRPAGPASLQPRQEGDDQAGVFAPDEAGVRDGAEAGDDGA